MREAIDARRLAWFLGLVLLGWPGWADSSTSRASGPTSAWTSAAQDAQPLQEVEGEASDQEPWLAANRFGVSVAAFAAGLALAFSGMILYSWGLLTAGLVVMAFPFAIWLF